MYPIKEYLTWYGTTGYREMTPEEYEDQLQWYRDYIKREETNMVRRVQEYVQYLKRWFGDGKCDNFESFEVRYTKRKLPMAYNIYFS